MIIRKTPNMNTKDSCNLLLNLYNNSSPVCVGDSVSTGRKYRRFERGNPTWYFARSKGTKNTWREDVAPLYQVLEKITHLVWNKTNKTDKTYLQTGSSFVSFLSPGFISYISESLLCCTPIPFIK